MMQARTRISAALLSAAAAATAITGPASAETWDMPMAYAESNFHTQNGHAFADAVREATGGELDIVVHASGSLFNGADIKRAVQTGPGADRRTPPFGSPE